MEPKTNLKPLALKTDLGDSFFDYEEVIRFEADGHYTIVYLIKDKQVRCSVKIKDLTPILPEKNYFRCHRSQISPT
jgi:DNA-binding LytR/AlgR family response regulator